MTKPSSSTNQASRAPSLRAASLARQAGSSITVLMSQRCQRMSGIDLTAMPVSAHRVEPRRRYRAGEADDRWRHVGFGEVELARPGAARHLQVDEAVAHTVAPDDLPHDVAERGGVHGLRDLQLAQASASAAPCGAPRRRDGRSRTSHTS